MSRIILPDNHYCFVASHEFKNIMASLLTAFGLRGALFSRFYRNDSGAKENFTLMTDIELSKATMAHLQSFNSMKVLQPNYESIDVFYNSVAGIANPQLKQHYEQQIALERNDYNWGDQVGFNLEAEHYVDHFSFATFPDDADGVARVLQHQELIQHFFHYFYEQADELLTHAYRYRTLWRKPPIDFSAFFASQKEVDKVAFLQAHPVKKVPFFNKMGHKQYLTKKEYVCAQFLVRGKTAKEIAQLLLLSPRTVETHIDHLRMKTACHTKTELINYLAHLNLTMIQS